MTRRCQHLRRFSGHYQTHFAVEKQPLPPNKDLWLALSDGQTFTKIDHRDSYQQLLRQNAARKYVAISTTLVLYQYTRLPFRVTSAPAIFQREINHLCREIRNVAVYLGDTLVAGFDDGNHLQNTHKILARLQDAALKRKLEKCVFLAPRVEHLAWDTSSLRPALNCLPPSSPQKLMPCSWLRSPTRKRNFRATSASSTYTVGSCRTSRRIYSRSIFCFGMVSSGTGRSKIWPSSATRC